MKRKTGILLVGIGGYGNLYVNGLLEHPDKEEWELKGVVDIHPERCSRYDDLVKSKIPVYSSMDDFYKVSSVDLAVIASPIQYHADHTCKALSHGSHVLCEKPVAAVIQDVLKMREQRDRSGKFVAVGYQWSYSDAILHLKGDILEGRLGKPIRMKAIVLWPRGWDYYARGWAGEKKDSYGRWVLDSVAANATSHYLHNMFFMLGDAMDRSTCLERVTAETYRANSIKNFDTAIIRAFTDKGVEIFFVASHAVAMEAHRGPEVEYIFEKAVVRYRVLPQSENAVITVEFNDGRVIDYGCPNENDLSRLWKVIEAVRQGSRITCGLEAASTHTVCINCVQEAVPEPFMFPEELVFLDKKNRITWIKGIAKDLDQCYTEWKMPYEAGIFWAHPGREISVGKYEFFKGE